jgi:hypothetical protein
LHKESIKNRERVFYDFPIQSTYQDEMGPAQESIFKYFWEVGIFPARCVNDHQQLFDS